MSDKDDTNEGETELRNRKSCSGSWIGFGLPVGMGIGAGIGATIGNLGLWIGIGVALGVGLGGLGNIAAAKQGERNR